MCSVLGSKIRNDSQFTIFPLSYDDTVTFLIYACLFPVLTLTAVCNGAADSRDTLLRAPNRPTFKSSITNTLAFAVFQTFMVEQH